MNPQSKQFVRLGVTTAAVFVLPFSSAHAQVTSTTPGEIAVLSNFGGAPTPVAPGAPVTNEFLYDELSATNLAAATADLLLSQGKYLVLYNCRVDQAGGSNRAEVVSHLSLEPAGGGAAVDLPYGQAQELIRINGGADEAVLSGGAIIEAANTNDILRLHTTRTDVNAGRTTNIVPNDMAIQFLKLDDGWDYLRLSTSADTAAATTAAFEDVTYDVVDEGSAGAMSFTSGSGDITFNSPGRYLVLANTRFLKPASNNTRTGYTQQLTLDGTPLEGSKTTTYLRGNPNSEQANAGVSAIGMIIEAGAGQVLNLEHMKESGQNSTIDAQGTALAIVHLPSFGQFISLSDTSGQNINPAGSTALNFGTQNGIPASTFSHTNGSSGVSVNADGAYLFLGAFFCDDDTADRQVPHQRWDVNASQVFYGQSSRYSRNNGVNNNGNWSGFVANLSAGDTVEMTTMALANNTAAVPGDSLGLQGVRIDSLFPSNDPVIAQNNPLNVLQSASGTITSALLTATDADTPATALTYTVESLPAPADGTLFLNGAPLAVSDTFTQDDVDNDLVTFAATAKLGAFGIDLTVSDGAASDTATFTVNVGLLTAPGPDTGTTDEDTILTMLDGAAASVLANDVGTGLTVSGFDTVSAQGAAVNVNADGTFSYEPISSALQALAVGEQIVDTFSYTVRDFANGSQQVLVSITVDGVNDATQAASETVSSVNASGAIVQVLANEIEIDTTDVLTVANFQDVFSNGGAVPAGMFNFEFVPLVFTSNAGATVSISADGKLHYDPSTSTVLLNLQPGLSLDEVFTYDVSDGSSTVQSSVTVTSTGAGFPTNDYATTDANTGVNISVLGNDQVRSSAGGAGVHTPGAVLDLDAGDAGNSDSNWANKGLGGGALVMEGAGTQSILVTPTNAPIGVTAAYDLSGTGSGDQILATDDANNLYGSNIGNANATIEMVFRPDAQTADQPLWGSGGNGTGTSLILLGDQVVFSVGQNAIAAQVRGTLPSGAIAGGEFVHVIATINLTTDTVELYINNVLVDTYTAIAFNTGLAGNLTDWSGTDDEGLGRSAGTTGGDINVAPFLGSFGTIDIPDFNDATQRFAGEIAVCRVYSGGPLNAAQRAANFDAIFGAPSPAVLGDVTDVAGSAPSVGTPINLPSGATVTLLGDGTIDYEPNGAFAKLGQGLTARDSFTYSLNTGAANTVTVNVDVSGLNSEPQVTVAADNPSVMEGSGTSFTISSSAAVSGPVNVALSFSGRSSHGADFSGLTTVQIPNAGTNASLSLSTADDGLFEGVENIIVTIDSVSGNAVLGGSTAAETILNDAQTAPEFRIAADQGSAPEGTVAGFTVTASVASQAERTVTVSYSGVAENGTDFLGQATVGIGSGAVTGDVDVIPFDDASVEGAESLIVTITTVDVGTIGAASSATTDITDGAGVFLFFADFNNVDPAQTPGGTLLGFDAPAAANLGTAIGSWLGVPTSTLAGDQPGLYAEIDDVKMDGFDHALVVDRPPVGEGDFFAVLTAPADLTGSSTALLGMDLGNRRTQNNTEDKSWRIIGLDDSGEASFELYVSGNNNAPHNEQLHHVDAGGVLTPLGSPADFDNTGSIEEESEQSRLILSLSAGGYQVGIDRWPIDGTLDVVTGPLAYAGSATQVSRIVFRLNANADTTLSSGILVDDISVAGTAGNQSPTATLGGLAIADGGATSLPDGPIATGTLLDGLQVDDVDAGAGMVTATFQSSGSGPLTFTASGPASVGGNGSGTLTLMGTLSNVNASLATGVTYTTDALSGGNAVISFTIDDGGNTGPGGAKSLSHDLTFFVNEGPTATIDQAPGQVGITSDSPIEFEVVFSESVTGFTSADVDLSGSSDGGPLVAVVSGAGNTYTVSVTGMTGGNVVISFAKGAANASVGGADTEAPLVIDDTVVFVAHLPPTASNLVQVIGYTGPAPVDIGDIFVSDPNDSVVTTPLAPQFDHPAIHGDSLNLLPDPDIDAGFAFEVAFMPAGFDDFGTVRVMEIGGTSNGTGLYLLDGVPHFVSKMDSAPTSLPAGFNDTDWGDGNVSVPLAGAPLPLDVPARIAVICHLDSLTFSVNGLGQSTVPLTGRTTQSNWSGDDTIRVGQNPDAGHGGLGTDPAGVFDDVATFPLEGTVSLARLWHAPDASGFSSQAVDAPEEIDVFLTFQPGSGNLTVPNGVTYDGANGLWNITGSLGEVNAALAAVQFLPNGTSPTIIDVTIDDGDEDGSGPLTGTVTLNTVSQDTDGDDIPDDYEIANGLNPNDPSDAESDSDADGWDALSEYLLGTAANDNSPGEVPVFEINHVSANRVEIIYGRILSGRTYEVFSTSTDDTDEVSVERFTAGADEASRMTIDTSGDSLSEIYRLEVTVPAP